MELAFQALVLGLTAWLWWTARRDLAAKAAELRAPASDDWERLRVTVEQLMVELERRAIVAEQRISQAELRLQGTEQRFASATSQTVLTPHPASLSETLPAPALPHVSPGSAAVPADHLTPEAGKYAMIDTLLAEGMQDAGDIARRTGLARGEVELVLSLRGRRM